MLKDRQYSKIKTGSLGSISLDNQKSFYEFFVYLYITLPLILLPLSADIGANVSQIVYIFGLLLWIPVFSYANNRSPIWIYILMIQIGLVFIYSFQGIQFAYDSLKMFSNLGVALFICYYRFRHLEKFLISFNVIVLAIYFLFVMEGTTGLSYHDLGLMLVLVMLVYVIKFYNPSFWLSLITFVSLIILNGRTQIFLGLAILTYVIINGIRLNQYRWKNIYYGIFICALFFFIFEDFILNSDFILADVKDRGFSLGMRQLTSDCYLDTLTMSEFMLGNNIALDNCIKSVWEMTHGEEVLQYENSFVRLNVKIGVFAVVLPLLLLYGILKQALSKNFLIAIILVLFFVRATTGDIFFFGLYDYGVFIVIIWSIWPNEIARLYHKI